MKDMIIKNRSVSFEDDDQMKCSAIATKSLVLNKEDMGPLNIPCTIGLVKHYLILGQA